MDRMLKGFHISATSFTHELLMQHMHNEEPEDNSRIIGDREAFFMVNELKKYALGRNATGLTQALTEAEELIEHSVLKNSSIC